MSKYQNARSIDLIMGSIHRFAPFVALALGGCVIVEVGDQRKGLRATRTHVGITRITTPPTGTGLAAVDVSTLGVGWDQGPFFGWHEGNLVFTDPTQCQLVVIIRSSIQAEHAAEILSALEGQEPCIADFTNSLDGQSR